MKYINIYTKLIYCMYVKLLKNFSNTTIRDRETYSRIYVIIK